MRQQLGREGRYDEKMSKNIAIQRADSTIVTTTCDSMEIVNAQQCEMRKKVTLS